MGHPVILQEHQMNSSNLSIDELWTRLKKYEGDKFATKKGKPFTYKISGGAFHSTRTGYNISKGEFQKTLELFPFDGPGVINDW